MSQCPFTNLLSLDTYVNGMPYEELAKIRQAGSMVYIDDPENGVPSRKTRIYSHLTLKAPSRWKCPKVRKRFKR